MWFPPEGIWPCGRPFPPEGPRVCGPGLVGAGPARERERSSRQDSRDLYCSGGRSFVSETRCNGGAFRDRSSHPWPLLVWPSLAKQLPPGTTIAPLTGQRNRHGSETPPGPFYKTLAANLPRSAGIGWARPGPCLARDGQTPSLQIPSCPSTGSGHSHLGDGVGRHPITRRVETLTAFQYSIHNVQQLAHAGHDDLFGPLAVRA